MIIEEGKRYVRRDGVVTEPLVRNTLDKTHTYQDPKTRLTWTIEGTYGEYKHSFDLVSIYKEETVADVINPSHYTSGSIECIDAIQSALSKEEFIGFLKGQVLKYTWRNGKKDSPSREAKKAEWYNARLIKELENE